MLGRIRWFRKSQPQIHWAATGGAPLLAMALGLLSGLLFAPNATAQAVDRLDEQLQLPTPVQRRLPTVAETEANRLFRLGREAKAAGQTSRAIGFWRGAIEQYELIQDFPAIGAVYNHIGFAYLELGEYNNAENALRRSLAVASDLNNQSQQIYGFNNIGTLLINKNNPYAAEDAFRSAIAIAQTVGDEAGEGFSLSNLGQAQAAQGNYEQAIATYQKAWRLRRRHPESGGQAITLNHTGDAFVALKRYDEALSEYRLARWYAQEQGDRQNEFYALEQLALNYGLTQRWVNAFQTLDEWVNLARTQQSSRQELRALHIYAQYYRFFRRWEDSYNLYKNAIAVAQRLGDQQAMEILHSEQSQILYGFPFDSTR